MTTAAPALLVLFTAIAAAADEPPRPAPQGSDDVEVVVSALRDPTPLARTPAAISVVDVPRELVASPAVTLDEPLAFVPGVVAHGSNNFAQDLQLSIRGFGARAAWRVEGGGAVWTPFVAAENVTSARYSDRVRINATGGRYFEPAPPMLVRGGLSIELR